MGEGSHIVLRAVSELSKYRTICSGHAAPVLFVADGLRELVGDSEAFGPVQTAFSRLLQIHQTPGVMLQTGADVYVYTVAAMVR